MSVHSAYARKGKSPYRYSQNYRDWYRATREGNDPAAQRAARAHEAQWGYSRFEINSRRPLRREC